MSEYHSITIKKDIGNNNFIMDAKISSHTFINLLNPNSLLYTALYGNFNYALISFHKIHNAVQVCISVSFREAAGEIQYAIDNAKKRISSHNNYQYKELDISFIEMLAKALL